MKSPSLTVSEAMSLDYWIEEFKVEQAKAIEEKRLEIELEVAAALVNTFLEQVFPRKAREEGDQERPEEIPMIKPGAHDGVPPENQAFEAALSQPNHMDSSQDQV